MIIIDNLLVSEDIIEKEFVCNLQTCKGACCISGDSGAPLEKEELEILAKEYQKYKSYLTDRGREIIEERGFYEYDTEDEKYKTPLIEGGPCVYINYDESDIAHCGIEKAYLDGKTPFKKPISCHLYPIRVSVLKNGNKALNYERWSVCKSACSLGKKLQVPIYKFLKEPITRAFGEETYQVLDVFANRTQAE